MDKTINKIFGLIKSKNWLQDIICLTALISISFGVYANSLNGDFLIDDSPAILEDVKIHNLNGYINKHLKITEIGFLGGFSTALYWHFFRDNPFGYHFLSVIFHIICIILVFFLCNQLFNNKSLSFISALIFAVHPIHTEAVSWISGRFYVIQSIFYLSSFICYAKSKKGDFWLVLCLVFTTACLAMGNNIVSLPIMFLAYDIFFREKDSEFKKGINFRILFLSFFICIGLIIALMYFIGRSNIIRTIYSYRDISYLIVIDKAFLYYLKILFLPLQRGLFHPFAYVESDIDKLNLMFFVSIAAFFLITYIFLRFRKKSKPISFGIMWFLVSYLPYSNIIPICNIISERYLYLPSAGYCIFISGLILKIWEIINKYSLRTILRKIAIIAVLLFLFSYAVLTILHNFDYYNIFSYWSSNLDDFPQGYKACNNLAGTFFKVGDLNNAAAYSYINLMIKPDQPHVWVNLGTIYEKRNDEKEAVKCYEKALEIDKNYYPARTRLTKINKLISEQK